MNEESFDIQELVERSGVPRRNIYFYVQQGLLRPPVGAGLAARYGSEHLLRLRLIPMLRGQGLRLDQIRERFSALSSAELERMLPGQAEAPETPPAPALERPPIFPRPPGGQVCTRYDLPGGIVIIIPTGLRPEHRALAERLVQAAGGDRKGVEIV